jgi:hypothetical protein
MDIIHTKTPSDFGNSVNRRPRKSSNTVTDRLPCHSGLIHHERDVVGGQNMETFGHNDLYKFQNTGSLAPSSQKYSSLVTIRSIQTDIERVIANHTSPVMTSIRR